MNIPRSKLLEVLSEYFPEEDLSLFEDIADELEDRVETPNSDASTFIKLLTYYRRRVLNHRNVKLSMPHNLPYVNKIIEDVNEFCSHNQLSKRAGYLEFIKIGISLMGKSYRINYFEGKIDQIFERYEILTMISKNPHKDIAKEISDAYIYKTLRMSGIKPVIGVDDERNFSEASLYCYQNKVPGRVLVDAIFDVLAWRNAIPSTSALVNPKFLNRVPDYMSKNELVVKDNVLTLSLKKLKDIKDD